MSLTTINPLKRTLLGVPSGVFKDLSGCNSQLIKSSLSSLKRFNATESSTQAAPSTYKSSSFLAPSVTVSRFREKPVYLDYQATTPVDPRVLDAMLPCFKDQFGNAHSRTHAYGWAAESMVEEGRGHIADLIGALPREIIFTSGATESNNLAIKGGAMYYGKHKKKKHLVTLQTEHKCVLASAQYLESEMGWDVTYLPVRSDGLVDLEVLKNSIRPDTAMVSVMLVNNEIGVIQPMKEIAKICRKHKVLLHTDAAQAVGKIPVNVNDLGVDLMSVSGHKIYGPKGIGALYVRSKPKVRLVAQMSGGGQERGIRSGTLPVPLCVGFGEAARIANVEMAVDTVRIKKLSDKFINKIKSNLEGVILNGSEESRYPGNCNLSFTCVEGESLLMAMRDVAVSSGSACTSASLEPSYVLRAIGVDEELAHTSIRFGIGKFTTEEEIEFVANAVIEAVNKLRSLSPLWEMRNDAGGKAKMVWT